MPEAAISEYFYGDEAEQFIYFRIPRQLITDPRFKHLSTDAKLLYGMLLDRMSLSVKNGWYDEDGRVYIYYTVEEICWDMNCGRDKAMKMLADLDTKKGVGLIRRVRQGQGKPTKLYVKRFTTGSVPSQPAPPEPPPFTPFSGVDFSGVQKSISPTSASRESRRAGVEKTDPNYTNQNQTDFSYKAKLAYEGGGDFHCGEWCRFCKAKAECRERAEANLALARYDFEEPPLLTDEEIAGILDKVDALTAWATDVKEYALQQAVSGTAFPGWKLVEGRSNRKYTSEAAVAAAVEGAGFDPYEKKLLGITAMQKLLGKSRFEELLAPYIEKPQGRPTLVRSSDKRPEWNTAKNDFMEEM